MLAAAPWAVNMLRMLFIAIMQLAAWETVAKVLENIVDYIRASLKKDGGLSESETDDAMLNTTIDAIAFTTVTVAALKTRLPIRLADKLGLKVGRASKTTLSTKVNEGIAQSASKGGLQSSFLKNHLGKLSFALVGSLLWFPALVQQFGDQAAFAPKAANDFYEKFFGLRPFTEPDPLSSPGPFQAGEFSDYARSLEAVGVVGIEYGFPKGTVMYSRKALAELVDYVYGQQALRGVSPTVAKLKPMLAPYLRTNTGVISTTSTSSTSSSVSPVKSGGASTPAAASLPAAGAGASTYVPVKVFTGVLSNGTLGAAQPFSAREDDLINSAGELRDIAQTNAAAFLAALPGKIVYEIKIVNSVITSDGTKRTGASVQVPNGVTKAGIQKYKYVTNKFAVMSLYFVKKEGTRTKIADITLGPTDVARFNPAASELAGIGVNLVQTVSTNSTNDISTIISDTPTESITSTSEPEPMQNYNFQPKQPGDLGYAFYRRDNPNGQLPSYLAVPDYKFYDMTYGRISEEEFRRGTGSMKDYTNSGYYLKDGVFTKATTYLPSDLMATSAPPTTTATAKAAGVAAKATNLSQYYAALGQPLPSLSARGQTYQSLGLGAASLYSGTVEQNTKLLIALQAN